MIFILKKSIIEGSEKSKQKCYQHTKWIYILICFFIFLTSCQTIIPSKEERLGAMQALEAEGATFEYKTTSDRINLHPSVVTWGDQYISKLGLKPIEKLQSIKYLEVHTSAIGNQAIGMEYIASLGNLQHLTFLSNILNFDELRFLRRLKSLKFLDFKYSWIRDQDCYYVSQIDTLEHLVIKSEVLTDNGIKELEKLKNLKRLEISDHLTKPAIDSLRAKNSKVEIIFDN